MTNIYTGILQIGPEMITEVNRLSKYDRFTLNDRLDSARSVKIWYVVQNYWNPTYDLKRACLVWNGNAGDWYYERIKKQL